jgi:threonine dehydrogenase-like Zn-dependent dehydrogenase
MLALVMQAPWVLKVEEVSTPEPGPDDVLVQITATGICGSDFHGFSGENGRRKPGQVMGHETVGHVAKVGRNVSDLAEGTCVTVNPVLSCDDCDVCRAGNEQSCPSRKVIGVAPELTSAFADYLLVRRSNVIALAEGVEPELGALVEPLAVGYHAASRGGCSSEDTVLVIGGGPIGQAAFLAARRLGATRVAVSDLNPTRRALCAELGAAVIDPSAKPLEESIVDALGAKATLVIDAVGATTTLADAMRASAFGARVVLVGMAGPSVELAAYAISTEERTLIGSFCYSRKHFDETAAWVGTTDAPLHKLIDGRVGFDGAQASFTELARGQSQASKILVFPGGVPDTKDDNS